MLQNYLGIGIKYMYKHQKGNNNMNKMNRYKIIIVILIVIIIVTAMHNIDIRSWFYDTNGNFDNSIMWTAIGSLSFFVAIITIIIEKIRINRANIHSLEEKKVIRNIENFEEECRLNYNFIIDSDIFYEIFNVSMENYDKTLGNIWKFQMQKDMIIAKLNWYYQGENLNEFPMYNKLITELNVYSIEFDQFVKNIQSVILEYGKAKTFSILVELNRLNGFKDDNDKMEYQKYVTTYENPILMCQDIKNRIGDKLFQYNQMRNITYGRIAEAFSEAIKEKNEITNYRLNKKI